MKGSILGEGSRSGIVVSTEVGNKVFSYPNRLGLYFLGPNVKDYVKNEKIKSYVKTFIYLLKISFF